MTAGRRMIDDLQLYNTIFIALFVYTNKATNTYMTYTLVLFEKEFRLNNVHIIPYIIVSLFHVPSITVDSHRAGAVV